MTKTVYIITHVDNPEDDILLSILDPDDDSKPTIYLDKALAETELAMFRERGLEFELKVLTLTIH